MLDLILITPVFGTLYNLITKPTGSNIDDYTIKIDECECKISAGEAERKCRDNITIQNAKYVALYSGLNIVHDVIDAFATMKIPTPLWLYDGVIDTLTSLYKFNYINDAAAAAKKKCKC